MIRQQYKSAWPLNSYNIVLYSIYFKAPSTIDDSECTFLWLVSVISNLGFFNFFFFLFPIKQHPKQHHLGQQLHVLVGGFFFFSWRIKTIECLPSKNTSCPNICRSLYTIQAFHVNLKEKRVSLLQFHLEGKFKEISLFFLEYSYTNESICLIDILLITINTIKSVRTEHRRPFFLIMGPSWNTLPLLQLCYYWCNDYSPSST